MIIEINKDIERYQETVVMGLTAKQLLHSIAAVAAGSGIVLFLYGNVGLTLSVYIAIPVVAPIALGGFYSYHDMGFYEVLERQIRLLFFNCPLVYVSTEGEMLLAQIRREEMAKDSRKSRSKIVFGKKK